MRILQEMPSFVELQIPWIDVLDGQVSQPSVQGAFLRRLTYDSSTDISTLLLPRLQAVTLCGPLPFDDHHPADMVQSRLFERPPDVACILFVGLQYHRQLEQTAAYQLRKFREEGLNLVEKRVQIEQRKDSKEWDGFRLEGPNFSPFCHLRL
jgi:hypothetical protein